MAAKRLNSEFASNTVKLFSKLHCSRVVHLDPSPCVFCCYSKLKKRPFLPCPPHLHMENTNTHIVQTSSIYTLFTILTIHYSPCNTSFNLHIQQHKQSENYIVKSREFHSSKILTRLNLPFSARS